LANLKGLPKFEAFSRRFLASNIFKTRGIASLQ
jgi:hypothetical protein